MSPSNASIASPCLLRLFFCGREAYAASRLEIPWIGKKSCPANTTYVLEHDNDPQQNNASFIVIDRVFIDVPVCVKSCPCVFNQHVNARIATLLGGGQEI